MTNQGKVNEFRSIMVEEIKMNVKSIYTKLYGEIAEDDSYELNFSDITQRDICIELKDYYGQRVKTYLDTIVLTENDIYMTGVDEDCDTNFNEIYFDELNTDEIATVADTLWNKNYKL